MYNKHLDSFIQVAEYGSFSKAAEACHISRTALIQQINLLEEHFGFPLFNRTSKGATLTPMGRLMLERSFKIVKLSAETLTQCRALQDKHQVRIGILPNLPLPITTQLCMEYHRQFPDTEIVFVERTAAEYLSAFNNAEFDVSAPYMSRLAAGRQEICFAPLGIDSFDCAVPPDSALAAQRFITPRDLMNRKVCLLVENVAQAEDRLRAYLTRKVADIQFVDIDSYTKSLPLTCIMQDMVMLHYHINRDEYLPLTSVPLKLEEPCDIELGLCYRPDADRDVRSFINFAEYYCQKNKIF